MYNLKLAILPIFITFLLNLLVDAIRIVSSQNLFKFFLSKFAENKCDHTMHIPVENIPQWKRDIRL